MSELKNVRKKSSKIKISSNLILRLPVTTKDIKIIDIFTVTPKITENDLINQNRDTYTIKINRMEKENIMNNEFAKPYTNLTMCHTHIKRGNWIRSTNIRCWWCSYTFDCTPCGIPISYSPETNEFWAYGCFCSFNCALAYIIEYVTDQKWEKTAFLHLMYQKIYKVNDKIYPAFPREILKDYGGTLDIDDYRQQSGAKEISYDVVIPPITAVDPQIERRNIMLSLKRLNRDTSQNNFIYDNTVVPDVKSKKKKSFTEKFIKKV